MKFAIVTFGCRVNQADSLEVEERLLAGGATPSAPERADVVVVNTCSVTASADQGARQTIRRIARDNPSARIVVTGCYASRRPDEVRALPLVARLVTNAEKARVSEAVFEEAGLTTAERFGDGNGACGAALEPGLMGRTAYTLRVQTGCEEACAYCIIPTTRGPGRSRDPRELLAEVRRIASAGFKEIVLTGVHLGSFGRDLPAPLNLAALLRLLADEGLDVLFRISSLEPMDCTPEIVDLVATGSCFAPHFHLPLQHASDRLLRAMRRPYTLDGYRSLVDGVRRRLPDASLGSDMIVGFPGETDEDAEESIRYVEGSPLTHLHVFPYSDRPGTVAAMLPSKVDGAAIRARAAEVRAAGRRLHQRFLESQRGSIRRGLTIEDGSMVVTDNYLKVRIPPGRPRNEWIRVQIDAIEPEVSGTVF
jgi:threonylcarbamoyladenosine tRNA methylthiotransferase MtaB